MRSGATQAKKDPTRPSPILHAFSSVSAEIRLVTPSFLPGSEIVKFLWTNITNFIVNTTSHLVSGNHYSRSTAPGVPFNFILEVTSMLSQLTIVSVTAAFLFLLLFSVFSSSATTM